MLLWTLVDKGRGFKLKRLFIQWKKAHALAIEFQMIVYPYHFLWKVQNVFPFQSLSGFEVGLKNLSGTEILFIQ